MKQFEALSFGVVIKWTELVKMIRNMYPLNNSQSLSTYQWNVRQIRTAKKQGY